MSKKWYFVFVVNTLILVAPYLWLILDIVEHADYNKLLLDACFAGPCLLLAELLWLFVRKMKINSSRADGFDGEGEV